MATILLPTSGSIARAASKCSAPNISVVSPSTDVAPSSTSRSLATPSAGLAVIPESASEPPHSRPRTIALHGAAIRFSAAAPFMYSFATEIAFSCNFSMDPISGSESVVKRVRPRDCAPAMICFSFGVPIERNTTA